MFDARGIKSNTLAFHTGVLLFEVSGQLREVQVCCDQLLLTFQCKEILIQKYGHVIMELFIYLAMKTEV